MSASAVTHLRYDAPTEDRNAGASGIRPDARFIAHLLATRGNVAEYRLKNRALPENGSAAYLSSMAREMPQRRAARYSI